MPMYTIVRYYQDHPPKIIKARATLEQAQEHCRNPETSSASCEGNEAIGHTSQYGEWFDGFRPVNPPRLGFLTNAIGVAVGNYKPEHGNCLQPYDI